jgi:hypothetical protein
MSRRSAIVGGIVIAVAVAVSSGCDSGGDHSAARVFGTSSPPGDPPGIAVPLDSSLAVHLTTRLTSGRARVGDSWTGVVVHRVALAGGEAIPAGSPVRGVVCGVCDGSAGSPAIQLELQSVCYLGAIRRLTGRANSVLASAPVVRSEADRLLLKEGALMTFTTGRDP